MLKLLTCLLTFCSVQANGEPFWKTKEKVYERVQNGEVIVGVHGEFASKQTPRNTLTVNGGGQLAAPRDFVFAAAQKYAELMRTSDYIRRANYDARTHRLDLDLQMLGYSSHIQVELNAMSAPEPQRIEYKIVAGPLAGFHGFLTFARISTDLLQRRCEVGIWGEYKYDVFPIPKVFLEFGMEVVFKRLAERLRSHVESEYNVGRVENQEKDREKP